MAKELFDMFGSGESDHVTEEEVLRKLDNVLRLYREKVRDDDRSGETNDTDFNFMEDCYTLANFFSCYYLRVSNCCEQCFLYI